MYIVIEHDPWSDAIDHSIKRVEEYDCLVHVVYKHTEEATYVWYGTFLFKQF